MSRLCDVQGNKNVELSKLCSVRNLSHELVLPGKEDKILYQGESQLRLFLTAQGLTLMVGSMYPSLSFLYQIYRTNKERRKKKNGAIARQLIFAKEKKYVYRTMFM